jgi:hypothetical protein
MLSRSSASNSAKPSELLLKAANKRAWAASTACFSSSSAALVCFSATIASSSRAVRSRTLVSSRMAVWKKL